MAKLHQVYKCQESGMIVEVKKAGEGVPSCCGKEMTLLEEKTADSSTEKHVPMIEKIDNGYKVTVGSTLHPMTEEHLIEWIELMVDDKVYTQYLTPDQEPVAIFMVEEGERVCAREYCNLHGHWQANL